MFEQAREWHSLLLVLVPHVVPRPVRPSVTCAHDNNGGSVGDCDTYPRPSLQILRGYLPGKRRLFLPPFAFLCSSSADYCLPSGNFRGNTAL